MLHEFVCHPWAGAMLIFSVQFSSVAQSCPPLCDPMDCITLWMDRPPCPSPVPGVYSNSCCSHAFQETNSLRRTMQRVQSCRLGFCFIGIYIKCNPMTRVYWLQVWLTPREQGEIMIVSQKRAEWFKISLAEQWQSPGSPSITDRGTAPHTQQWEVLWKLA